MDLLEDIYTYWVNLVGGPDHVEDLKFVSVETIAILRKYSAVDMQPSAINSKEFKKLFGLDAGENVGIQTDAETKSNLCAFAGLTQPRLMEIHHRFYDIQKSRKIPFRSLISLNARSSLETFYRVIEQVPFWFDPQFWALYSGGSGIINRPRVEDSLTSFFNKRVYYVVMWYVFCNVHQLGVNSLQPMKKLAMAVGKDADIIETYSKQFEYQHWFQLAHVLTHHWGGELCEDLESIRDVMQDIEKFKVLL